MKPAIPNRSSCSIMLRIFCRNRHLFLFRFDRPISSSFSSLFSTRSPSLSSSSSKDPACYLEDGRITKHIHLPSIPRHQPPAQPLRAEFRSPAKVTALSAALLSAMIASYAFISGSNSDSFPAEGGRDKRLYDDLHRTIERTSTSFGKIVDHMKHTGAAVCVLWQSLRSVLSSANHEVRAGFELRVASFLADIVAVNESRRSAIVGAGGGVVLDWLLQIVATRSENSATQSESARALAYLIADPNVSGAVLGRPHAVPNLLRFIFSFQPKNKKHPGHSSFDASHSLNGRSMLVAAIMDIITSSCDTSNDASSQPLLSRNAETRDIATVIQVIEEGSMHFDESDGNEDDDDGGKGLRGIGIKVIGEAAIFGFSRVGKHMENYSYHFPMKLALHQKQNSSLVQAAVVPGLWDDLHCQHVAVPFAAWALANWAMASYSNRARINDLDQDGYAITTALTAPERTVKWHGSLIARLLLEDKNIPITDSVSDWSQSLLLTTSQASKINDIPLTQAALSAFLLAVEKCIAARKLIVSEGLPLMRETAKRTEKHLPVQEGLAKALELLCNSEMHISLEEGQRWSGILLSWIFGKSSSDCLRTSATKILTSILEEQGSFSVPISQGWLALLLDEAFNFNKRIALGSKNDNVKTQIDQSNISSATHTMNQLAAAVVNSARRQLDNTGGSGTYPFEDLLSLELFSKISKGSKSESPPKFDAADSALKTLSGIKALTNVCSYDASLQNRIVDFGVLCLLRRFLLQDDYEKLAAAEAYDASRSLDSSDLHPATAKMNTGDASNIRVPPTAHIRRHAAQLLVLLSLLGIVKDAIASDKLWCKWLEDCACGKITGCIDPKTQSYCRATLLNIFCNDKIGEDSGGTTKRNLNCSRYEDMIFLINPHLPHWKCCDEEKFGGSSPTNDDVQSIESIHFQRSSPNNNLSASSSRSGIKPELPPLDVVFIHGLRGGPFKTWRIADDKTSSKSGFVERIDQEAGKQGTFWPGEWLSDDFPDARLFTLRYKTNLTQWSGASLPLQEVSSMLLDKLVAAGIGRRPVVFVTHSMGGLVVKQILFKAMKENIEPLIKNTIGIVFYSCPHFGSKLADMPWRMGFVLRPALSIGELRSGSSRLFELNDFIRNLHKKGLLDVLSFCETKVTPIVEGYGGWALRMEIVPIESAYPGFGELVVLESTDHVNSCKPLDRMDPSYKEMLNFLRKLKVECA